MQNNSIYLPLPEEIQIEPTVRCNMDCVMCDSRARNRAPDMSIDVFKRIIDQLNGVKTLGMHGLGESLLNKNFPEMVEYALSKGFNVRFNTNVSMMTPEIATRMISAGLNEIRFSIDAPNRQIFKQLRGVDLFEQVIEKAKGFIKLRGTKKLPYVKLVIVLMKENLNHLNEMIELGTEIGVDEIFVQNMQSWTRKEFRENESLEHSIFALDKAELEKAYLRVKQGRVKISLPPLEEGKFNCTWPYTGAWISVEGFLCPCCECHDPRILNFGNVLERPIIELWNSQEYNDFRKVFDEGNAKICQECILKKGVFKVYGG